MKASLNFKNKRKYTDDQEIWDGLRKFILEIGEDKAVSTLKIKQAMRKRKIRYSEFYYCWDVRRRKGNKFPKTWQEVLKALGFETQQERRKRETLSLLKQKIKETGIESSRQLIKKFPELSKYCRRFFRYRKKWGYETWHDLVLEAKIEREIEKIEKEIWLKRSLVRDPKIPLRLGKVVENFLKDYPKNEIIMRFEKEIKKEVVKHLRKKREKMLEINFKENF